MNKYNEQIAKVEKAIVSEQKTEMFAISSIGQGVYDTENNSISPDEFENIADLIKEITELEELQNELQIKITSEKQLKDKIKTLNIEQKAVKKDIQSNLPALGKGAWEYWKFGGSFNEAEDILEHLIKDDTHLQDMDNAILNNRKINSKLGKTLFSKGKEALISSKRKLVEISMDKQWETTGKKILARVPLNVFSGTQAEIPAEKIQILNKKNNEIESQIQELKNECQELQTTMESVQGKGNSASKLDGIETTIKIKRTSLDEAYRRLGNLWLQSDKTVISNDEIVSRNKRLEEIKEKIKILENDQQTLEQQREYDKLLLEKEKKAIEINDHEQKITKLQSKLKTLKKQLRDIENQAIKISSTLPEPTENK